MKKNLMSDKPGVRPLQGNPADEQQMEQIREILFGEQQRDTERRIASLANRIGEQDDALRRLIDERIGAALDALRGELGEQADSQRRGLDGLETALHALLGKTEERLNLLDSDLQDTAQNLRNSISEQAAAHDALAAGSVQRAQLATLLEQMAAQLRSGSDT